MSPRGAVTIIVPFKGRRGAKARLSPALDLAQREALAFAMADHVLSVCAEFAARVVVVTACSAAEALASRHGAEIVADTCANGTAAAYHQALQWLGAAPPRLLLNGDLPALTRADLEAMLEVPAQLALAPDTRETGTNAVYLPPGAAFIPQFGQDSFARHRQYAADAGASLRIVRRFGLANDIDTPDDLNRDDTLYALVRDPERAR